MKVLAQRLRTQGRLQLNDIARIFKQVGRAVDRAHAAGIVHRDLKPDNVFLVRDGVNEIAKVLDFGIAKVQRSGISTATQTGAVLGTPHYMSPEQARGTRTVDWRTDLWAMGVIAFECVTGRRPFESTVLGDLLLKICAEAPAVAIPIRASPKGFRFLVPQGLRPSAGRAFSICPSTSRGIDDGSRLVSSKRLDVTNNPREHHPKTRTTTSGARQRSKFDAQLRSALQEFCAPPPFSIPRPLRGAILPYSSSPAPSQ